MFFVTVLALCATIWPGTPSAEVLSYRELQERYGPSIVYIGPAQTNEIRGYGILISPEGHVLTATHILDKIPPHAIGGRLGSKANGQLKLKRIGDLASADQLEKEALTLLTFTSEPTPRPVTVTPIGGPREYTADEHVGIVTASLVENTPSIITASPTASGSAEFLELAAAGINFGASGSPVYDRAGNLIGILADGDPNSAGRFRIRTALGFRKWLKNNNVPIADEAVPQNIVALYIHVPTALVSNLREAMVLFLSSLSRSFVSYSNDWLRTPPILIAPTTPAFDRMADVVFRRTSSDLQKKAKIEEILRDDKSTLREVFGSSAAPYLVLSRIAPGFGGYALSHYFLQLDQQMDRVTALSPLLVSSIPQQPDEGFAAEEVIDIFQKIIAFRPSFGRNGWLFADCPKVVGPAPALFSVAWLGADIIARKLSAKAADNRQILKYRIESIPAETCTSQLRSGSGRRAPAQGLSQLVLRSQVLSDADKYRLKWTLGPAWDAKGGVVRQMPNLLEERHLRSSDDFGDIADRLAHEIVQQWDGLFGQTGSSPTP